MCHPLSLYPKLYTNIHTRVYGIHTRHKSRILQASIFPTYTVYMHLWSQRERYLRECAARYCITLRIYSRLCKHFVLCVTNTRKLESSTLGICATHIFENQCTTAHLDCLRVHLRFHLGFVWLTQSAEHRPASPPHYL